MSEPWHWDAEALGAQGMIPDERNYFNNRRLATPMWRWAAGLIDWGGVFLLPALLVIAVTGSVELGNIVGLGFAFCNSGYLAAKTTQSLGKRICGIRIVQVRKDTDNLPVVCFVPMWVAFIRLPLHYFVDWLPLAIGFWLIPVANKSKGTIADYLCKTVHYRDPLLPPAERLPGRPTDWPG